MRVAGSIQWDYYIRISIKCGHVHTYVSVALITIATFQFKSVKILFSSHICIHVIVAQMSRNMLTLERVNPLKSRRNINILYILYIYYIYIIYIQKSSGKNVSYFYFLGGKENSVTVILGRLGIKEGGEK